MNASEKNDYCITRGDKRFAGVHLLIDLYGASHLNDQSYIEKVIRQCIISSGATLLHIHLHPFDPEGVSGVAVLAESHISVHTWPENGYAAFDVFMCGETDPYVCREILFTAFKAEKIEVKEILRGEQS